jgi:subtilisin family serine protease
MSRPAALLLTLFALTISFAPAPDGWVRRPPAQGSSRSAEVIVGLDASLGALTDEALEDLLGMPVASRLPELNAAVVSPGDGAAEAVADIEKIEGVLYAEPNRRLTAAAAPDDPLYPLQAHYMDPMGVADAWTLHRGDSSVVVAVLDSGVDLEHADLEHAIWRNKAETRDNGIDDDGNGCVDDVHGCAFFSQGTVRSECATPVGGDVEDDYGHGTFVAGIIAAEADNGTGVAGIAPGVTVMPVKILDCTGGGSVFDAAQGLLYAAKNGASIANLSFGMDEESSTLAAAIRQAYYGYGMIVVAATGSTGEATVQFPARMPEVISVASSGNEWSSDGRSRFSNWGPEVTVAAPGYGVVSTVAPGLCPEGWMCFGDEPYAAANGSSFAAPMVTALAALLLSENPSLPPDVVRGVIRATAHDLPDEGEMPWDGAGRIQVLAAMQFARYWR